MAGENINQEILNKKYEDDKKIINEDEKKKIKGQIVKAHNCRLVLYLKYENLSYKISTIQVLVIIASTIITFFETLKEQMNINNRDLRVISISLSTFIAISLSIARYLKMDESKENIYKLLQEFANVEKELKVLKNNYETCNESEEKRIKDNYNDAFTLFNTILTYNENIYYRRQILNMNFEDKINDLYENKIEELNNITIDKLNRFKRFECLDNCLRNIFGPACCFVHRYRYNDFFKEYDYDASNNKLIYTHKSTICEKCCNICLYKCNRYLDLYIENQVGDSKNTQLNDNDIENAHAEKAKQEKQAKQTQQRKQEEETKQTAHVNKIDEQESSI